VIPADGEQTDSTGADSGVMEGQQQVLGSARKAGGNKAEGGRKREVYMDLVYKDFACWGFVCVDDLLQRCGTGLRASGERGVQLRFGAEQSRPVERV
jgi:hypothetical protein